MTSDRERVQDLIDDLEGDILALVKLVQFRAYDVNDATEKSLRAEIESVRTQMVLFKSQLRKAELEIGHLLHENKQLKGLVADHADPEELAAAAEARRDRMEDR
jgi:parvulin-like peptidyl-prolyl isomerase